MNVYARHSNNCFARLIIKVLLCAVDSISANECLIVRVFFIVIELKKINVI